MPPQLAAGGGIPSPRNESAATIRMASATWNVALTTTTPMVFGMMWRSTIRTGPPPITPTARPRRPVRAGARGRPPARPRPGGRDPRDPAEHEDQHPHARGRPRRQEEQQEQRRDRQQGVDDAHHEPVDEPADVARDGAP